MKRKTKTDVLVEEFLERVSISIRQGGLTYLTKEKISNI